MNGRFLLFVAGLFISASLYSQQEARIYKMYDDARFHMGFYLGVHWQNLVLNNSGNDSDSGHWFADVSSYRPGLSVGFIADRNLSPFLHLRVTPAVHLGEKEIRFREYFSGQEFRQLIRSSYLYLPVDIKYTAEWYRRYRPYLLVGIYSLWDMGKRKDVPVHFHRMDYGITIGVGCERLFPSFRLSPEIRFCIGLKNILKKEVSSIENLDFIPYRNALTKARSGMVILVFNFE